MAEQPIAVVTGGNRGLGLETTRQLARKGYHVIFTARDARAGADTLARLQNEKLSVEMRRVDVTRAEDARALADYIRDTWGGFDVLVNNAGLILESSKAGRERSSNPLLVSPMTVMETLNVNTLGALRMIQALATLLRENGRIVNVSSGMGALTDMDSGVLGYRLSKTAMNTLTRVFSRELAPRNIKVNSVCPGWVRTDLGGENASRSVEDGAAGIVWAATLGPEGPSGGFFRDGKPIDW
ncbi:MAG: SDR family NAD(P)-dependent oxidoreductase [Gammaproteobacteria bacterium]|jgi:NAD(P)-dependent dehydrogenase (short-subunit alcohol dehydrogenase family)